MSAQEIDLSPLADKDPLTLKEAAYCWAGLLPTMNVKALREKYPDKLALADAWLQNLQNAAKAGKLDHDRPDAVRDTWELSPIPLTSSGGWGDFEHPSRQRVKTQRKAPVPWPEVRVFRAALRVYADSVGQRPPFLFPEAANTQVLRCLDPSNPHFSDELAAAFLAWQYASEMAEGAKKKPRQLIEDWLKKNRPAMTPGSKAYERIATLANWEKTPGAKALK